MANTVTVQVRSGLNVRIVNGTLTLVDYQARPSGFDTTIAGADGPAPGEVKVLTTGTIIDFSALSGKPGLCRIMNQDPTNYVTYGILHSFTGKFFPLGELLPGETYVLRLSRSLGQDFSAAGTGSMSDDKLVLVANTATCRVVVEAFPQ